MPRAKKKAAKPKITDPKKRAKSQSGKKKEKYTIEEKAQCMALWTEGYSFNQIAKIMGYKTHNTVASFKSRDMPVNWEKHKKKWQEKIANSVQKQVRKSLNDIKEIQNRALEIVILQTSTFLSREAKSGNLDQATASRLFINAIQEQQKLYMPIEKLYGPESKAPQLLGARLNQDAAGNTEASFLTAFSDAYEEAHPKEQEEKDESTKYIEG